MSHNITKWVRAQRRLRSAWAPAQSESSLCAQWKAEDPSFLHADSEDSDQTGWMRRLISLRWAHSHFVGFVVLRLIWTSSPVFGVCDQLRLKPAYSAIETGQSLEISAIASRGIILSRRRTTKALIRLRGCAGWSAPLLFAYDINRFSYDVAQLLYRPISASYTNTPFLPQTTLGRLSRFTNPARGGLKFVTKLLHLENRPLKSLRDSNETKNAYAVQRMSHQKLFDI